MTKAQAGTAVATPAPGAEAAGIPSWLAELAALPGRYRGNALIASISVLIWLAYS